MEAPFFSFCGAIDMVHPGPQCCRPCSHATRPCRDTCNPRDTNNNLRQHQRHSHANEMTNNSLRTEYRKAKLHLEILKVSTDRLSDRLNYLTIRPTLVAVQLLYFFLQLKVVVLYLSLQINDLINGLNSAQPMCTYIRKIL